MIAFSRNMGPSLRRWNTAARRAALPHRLRRTLAAGGHGRRMRVPEAVAGIAVAAAAVVAVHAYGALDSAMEEVGVSSSVGCKITSRTGHPALGGLEVYA